MLSMEVLEPPSRAHRGQTSGVSSFVCSQSVLSLVLLLLWRDYVRAFSASGKTADAAAVHVHGAQLQRVKTAWRETPYKNASGPLRSFHFHSPAAPRYRIVIYHCTVVIISIFPRTRRYSCNNIVPTLTAAVYCASSRVRAEVVAGPSLVVSRCLYS